MKVFILTEGGKRIGFGHITRCSAIAEAFEKNGIKPHFIVAGDNSVKAFFKGKESIIFNWPGRQDKLLKCIAGADTAIIDSYLAKRALYKKIVAHVRLAVYLDDNNRIKYPEGIIINGSIYAKKLDYPKKPGTRYLLGVKYAFLRKEFWEVPEKAIWERVEKVLVTFGGSDMTNETLKILKILKEQYPDFKKSVIVGRSFSNINQIKTEADKNTTLIYSPDAQSMKREMLKADICISGGGQTTYELARLGVPTIGICFAHNQLLNLTGFARSGFIKFAGWYNEKTVFSKIKECLDTPTYKNRLKMSRVGRELVDGSGARRVVMAILSDESVCKHAKNKSD